VETDFRKRSCDDSKESLAATETGERHHHAAAVVLDREIIADALHADAAAQGAPTSS
jgi:hypothetical protein